MWPSGVYKILSECLTLKKIKKSHVKMQIRGLLEEISISGALGASPPRLVKQDVLCTPLLAFVLWMQKQSSRQMKMGLGG